MELPRLDCLPLQGEGDVYSYAFSPNAESLQEMRRFFDEFGFVVVRDVYSEEECAETRDAMWSILEEQNPGFIRSQPMTWSKLKGKGQYGLSIRGPSFHPTFIRNRQNPRLANILCHLCEAQSPHDIIVSQDRFTVYRATVHENPEVNGEQFSTGESNLHLDLNPWWYSEDAAEIKLGISTLQYEDPQDFIKENNLVVRSFGRHVQCVLNFEDNYAEDGGTLIVPYFHKYMEVWAQENAALRKSLPWLVLPPAEQSRLLQFAHRVCMRAGSVLVWDQRVLHGTARNSSRRCRMAQYLKAYPRHLTFPDWQVESNASGESSSRLVRRANGIAKQLRASSPAPLLSELGWHMFGLDTLAPYSERETLIPCRNS